MTPFPTNALDIDESARNAWDAAVDLAASVASEMRALGERVEPAFVDVDAALRPTGEDFVLCGFVFTSKQLEQVWAEAVR